MKAVAIGPLAAPRTPDVTFEDGIVLGSRDTEAFGEATRARVLGWTVDV
jgi:hypothetical protein